MREHEATTIFPTGRPWSRHVQTAPATPAGLTNDAAGAGRYQPVSAFRCYTLLKNHLRIFDDQL
jgi:hypothetical protein